MRIITGIQTISLAPPVKRRSFRYKTPGDTIKHRKY